MTASAAQRRARKKYDRSEKGKAAQKSYRAKKYRLRKATGGRGMASKWAEDLAAFVEKRENGGGLE